MPGKKQGKSDGFASESTDISSNNDNAIPRRLPASRQPVVELGPFLFSNSKNFRAENARLAIITGGGTGIGQGLALKLAKEGINVLIAGRTESTLKETQSKFPEKIRYVVADIGTRMGREALMMAAGTDQIGYLVLNAASFKPLGKLEDIDEQEFQVMLNTNVVASMSLIKMCIPMLEGTPGARVLFVGSAAARSPLLNAGAYSITKMAQHMVMQVFQSEKKGRLLVGGADPGVVMNTPLAQSMLDDLKKRLHTDGCPAEKISETEKYITDMSIEPEIIGEYLFWVLFHTDEAEFVTKEFVVADWARANSATLSSEIVRKASVQEKVVAGVSHISEQSPIEPEDLDLAKRGDDRSNLPAITGGP